MKKILLFLFVLSLSPIIKSQNQTPFPSKEEIKQFMASKTCVVLEADPFYNAYIKEAVKNFWTITPYEFIEVKEFNVRKLDPAYSFIVLTETNFDRDKSGSVFNFINLLEGKKVDKLVEIPEICAVPLSFLGADDYEYGFKLGVILSFMQKHAKMISDDPSLTGRRYLRYYNKNTPEVVNKTILVREEDLSPAISTIEKIKAIYSHSIRIVSEDSIRDAIDKRAPNTLILHKVGPAGNYKNGYCFVMLIGADDADMYYYNYHLVDAKSPNGLLESDLKRLARY